MIKGLSRTILAGIIIAIIAVGAAVYLIVTTIGVGQPEGKPKLVIWGRATFVPPQLYWVEQKVRKWASEKGVDIEITWIPVAEIGKKLLAAVEAGSPPDIVINGHPVAVFAEKDLLIPLDDIVDKLGRDDIYEIKLKTCTFMGRIYCIPMHFEITWLHVRMDIVQKANASTYLPPKSFEDLYVLAKILNNTEPGVYGIGWTYGLNGFDTWWMFEHLWAYYGGGMLENRSSTGVIMDKPPYREGLEKAFAYVVKFLDEKLTPPDSTEWVDISNNLAYIQGRVAMTLNALSIYYALLNEKPELAAKTKLFLPPVSVDLGDESVFIFKTTKYPDLAKDLVYYLFKDKDDYRVGFCESGALYSMPIFKSQVKKISDAWKQGKWPALGEDPATAVEKIKYHETAAFPLGERITPSELFREGFIWNEMIQRVVIKKEDPDKIIDEYASRFREEVRKAYGS